MQNHEHYIPTYPIIAAGGALGLPATGQSIVYNDSTGVIKTGRYDSVTHGKQKGVKYIIKVL